MRKNGFILLLMLFSIATAGKAHGWGAVNGWCMTHQEIDKQAYLQLQQDPAFKDSPFPSLPEILAFEGVNTRLTEKFFEMTGLGPGPDALHVSPYAWHYYNPKTHAGKAPGAVSVQLYYALSSENQERTKGVCWAAHFLADMSVPYHVVGIPRQEALDHALNNRHLLSEDDTGPLFLYGALMRKEHTPAEGWGLLHNFTEATRFYVHNMANEEADWYDPWYANGYGLSMSQKVGTSSHVLWEYAADRYFDMAHYPHAEGRYNPVWINAEPNYGFIEDAVTINQSDMAVAFAESVAAFTRDRIEDIHRNQGMGLNNAIRNVVTLWRASISGLRPQLEIKEMAGQPNAYRIECLIHNQAGYEAFNPSVRLTMRNLNGTRTYLNRLNGRIASGGAMLTVFDVAVAPHMIHEATAEVVAAFQLPDLQYATVSTIFASRDDSPAAPPPAPRHPLVEPSPPQPAGDSDPEFTLWRGTLDTSRQQAVLKATSGGRYYERYDADEMTLKLNRQNKPVELMGSITRTIVSVIKGKDYEIQYNFETVYTPKASASDGVLIVDRLTHKTTTTTTFKPPNKRDRKTVVEKFHDPNCKLQIIKKETDTGDYLVLLPHGSSNAPDVPWRLHRISP